MFKRSPLWIGVVLAALVVVYLNLPQASQTSGYKPGATPVATQIANIQALPLVIEGLGTAQANESVVITAQQSEIITDIFFEDGQSVQAGQKLLQLRNVEQLARTVEIRANLQEASQQLTRIKNLAKSNSASQQLLDEKSARVNALQAQLTLAEANLEELTINAPFAGQLGIRKVSLGAYVRPGDEITTLDDVSLIKVDFALPEIYLPKLSLGQSVFARSKAYPNEVFNGTIQSVDSRVDPISRSVMVRAVINNQANKLRPGMLLNVILQEKVLHSLVIEERALIPRENKQFVFVVKDGQVAKREVIIGERRPGLVEITQGLQVGEEVVIGGTLRIRDGSQVTVIEQVN